MNNIHSTAIVSPKAKLGDSINIGPYAIIHDDVEISDGCSIGPHAVLYDGARLGKSVQIFQAASVANFPQDLKFGTEKTYFYIGDNTVIREFTALHRGTTARGYSKIGKNCLIMAYVHIAHDCVVGDNCILANGVQMAGHVTVEDWVTIGGLVPIHQFSRIGMHSMIGGGFRVPADIPPYILAAEEPIKYKGLNIVGLRRRGFPNEDIYSLKKTYEIIYQSGLNLSQAKEKIACEMPGNQMAENVLNFIANSKRGIIK